MPRLWLRNRDRQIALWGRRYALGRRRHGDLVALLLAEPDRLGGDRDLVCPWRDRAGRRVDRGGIPIRDDLVAVHRERGVVDDEIARNLDAEVAHYRNLAEDGAARRRR